MVYGNKDPNHRDLQFGGLYYTIVDDEPQFIILTEWLLDYLLAAQSIFSLDAPIIDVYPCPMT